MTVTPERFRTQLIEIASRRCAMGLRIYRLDPVRSQRLCARPDPFDRDMAVEQMPDILEHANVPQHAATGLKIQRNPS